MNKFLLIVSSGTLDFYLASRMNIGIEETSEFQTFAEEQANCGGCNENAKFSTKFKIHFIGGCSLATSWTLYNQLIAFLGTGCTIPPPVIPPEFILRRRVFDEPFQTWKITNSRLRIVDVANQYVIQHILTVEWAIDLVPWPPAGSGTVVVGP